MRRLLADVITSWRAATLIAAIVEPEVHALVFRDSVGHEGLIDPLPRKLRTVKKPKFLRMTGSSK